MRNVARWVGISVFSVMTAATPSVADANAEKAADRCGTKVRLRGAIYNYEMGELQPGISAILDELAKIFLERCREKLLIIEAHASEMPTPELNQRLSELRAHTLRFELGKRGIPESQILPAGLGSSRPEAASSEPDALNVNRRVTFRVAD